MRILASGMAIAEATGRQFAMWWPRTEHCGATFQELFENPWPVYEADPVPDLEPTLKIDMLANERPDFVASSEPHLKVRSPTWIHYPTLYPEHAALEPRCMEVAGELTPTAALRQIVDDFRESHFRPSMIGVHLRRGDMTVVRPDLADNTRGVLKAIDRRLRETPDAGILLCSDDGAVMPSGQTTRAEGVHALFRKRYGDRVVWNAPRTLDRADPMSVQDALVDLSLLRHTDYFIGTAGSSFSLFVVYGRNTPHVLIGSTSVRYLFMQALYRFTGFELLVRLVTRLRYGKHIPFAYAMYLLRNRNKAAGGRNPRVGGPR